jgi:phosphoribosylcarboxyaminoimidazole (NCAIR) mutase
VSEAEVARPFVIVLMGPRADKEVLQHTFRVLNHFGIPYRMADWEDNGLPNLLACADREGGVVVFGTGSAYTDEHYPLSADISLPVIKFVTGFPQDSGQMLTSTPLVMMTGFGIPGAVNAGLQATRILASNNAALRNLLKTKPYPGP